MTHLETVAFGPSLAVERFRFGNGLELLFCEDHSAPVIAYHTWFRVGSRHEREGKTGLAHLFEHLMFNEVEGRKAGEFDRKLEEAGAESNASTWLDFTQYNVSIPKDQLPLVVKLESERMSRLVLRDPQVKSEKEVVANERRYRVDDDVEGAVSELLWATAFENHAYRWPTIGWMKDIEGFTTEDCQEFYRTYYAPNNAVLVIVGDVAEAALLKRLSAAYGALPASTLPIEDVQPEPPQLAERRVEVSKPTATEKLVVGYHSPAMGDFDHPALSLLGRGLVQRSGQPPAPEAGARAGARHRSARVRRALPRSWLVRAVRLGPRGTNGREAAGRDRRGVRESSKPKPSPQKRSRAPRPGSSSACSPGLETVDGKASTLGFYEIVLGRPGAAFERLDTTRRVTASDLIRVARRYLLPRYRSVIFVRPDSSASTDDDDAEAAQ